MKYFKVRLHPSEPPDADYWVIYEVATGKEVPIKFHDWRSALVEVEYINKTYGKTQQETKYDSSKN